MENLFGKTWDVLSQPVTATVVAIDQGEKLQIGLSAMQLRNLQLNRTTPIDAEVLMEMVTRNEALQPENTQNYDSGLLVQAGSKTARVKAYNAFGHLCCEDDGVRISVALARKLNLAIASKIKLSKI